MGISKLSEANWIVESDAPFFRVNHFIQMESVASKASKDNNDNFLLLLIVPIYAAIMAVAIDFLLYRTAIRKK